MGLITKEVEIGIGGANYKHYKELGYEIPMHYNEKKKKWQFKNGEKITVKVEHLLKSAVNVEILCDCCNKITSTSYQAYLRNLHDGKYYCLQCACKIFNGGENSYKWNPNLTDEERENNNNNRYKNIDGYLEFTRIVRKRDNYSCVVCGSKYDTKVHHLNGFSWDIENRINPDNGVCLCNRCHEIFHKLYGKGNNTKEQFEEWTNNLDIKEITQQILLSDIKKVILLNNNKIYNSVNEASKELGVDKRRIYDVCNHVKYSINDLHFMYLEEYENTPKEELKNAHTYQGHNSYGKGNKKKVICITTNEVFESITEASKSFGLENILGKICDCCKGKNKSAGKLKDGTPLKWMYYDDFIMKQI